jgi:lipopolysaccharide export system protein LptC
VAKPPPSARDAAGAFRRRAPVSVNAGYSRLVQAMKVALPLTALGILALVASWSVLVEPTARKFAEQPGDSELLKPRYFSVDEKGQPFSLTAKRAKESDSETGIVNLEEPEAEMTETGGGWVTLRSQIGFYNRQTRLLRMVGAVRILRDDGTEYHTEEAFSDIAAGTSWGDVPIVGQGPQGEVAAEGFRMTDRGKTIVLVNRSAVSTPAGSAPPTKAQDPAPPTKAQDSAPPISPAAPESPSITQAPPPRSPAVAVPVATSVAPPVAVPVPVVTPTPPQKAQAAPNLWTPPPPKRKPIPPKRN